MRQTAEAKRNEQNEKDCRNGSFVRSTRNNAKGYEVRRQPYLAFGVAIPRRAVMSDRAWLILFTSFFYMRLPLFSARQSGRF